MKGFFLGFYLVCIFFSPYINFYNFSNSVKYKSSTSASAEDEAEADNLELTIWSWQQQEQRDRDRGDREGPQGPQGLPGLHGLPGPPVSLKTAGIHTPWILNLCDYQTSRVSWVTKNTCQNFSQGLIRIKLEIIIWLELDSSNLNICVFAAIFDELLKFGQVMCFMSGFIFLQENQLNVKVRWERVSSKYLFMKVYSQCALLTWRLTLSYEMLCSYG